ncbi:hypothetical protein SAMN04488156_12814 [Bacillus sp. 166amftsu]|nr:hypothetical protein SAMN04488156_12814 [Bacillus sp. 166amftsu]
MHQDHKSTNNIFMVIYTILSISPSLNSRKNGGSLGSNWGGKFSKRDEINLRFYPLLYK